MPDTKIVDEFIQHLSAITDAATRERLLAQIRLRAANATPDEAFEPPIRTLGQYLSDPIEIPPVLVEPRVVVRGAMGCTVGRAGKGKTVMNMNRLLKWSAGLPMFDSWTDQEGNVPLKPVDGTPLKILVIENEGSAGMFHQQLGIMLHAEGYLDEESRKLAKENLLIWGEGGYSGLKLDDPQKLDQVRRGCEKWEPDIVFIEPLRGLWRGDENSSTDMAKVVDSMNDVATDYSCAVWLAHHERKSGVEEDGDKMSAARGSGVLEGAVATMENFEAVTGNKYRELSWSKARYSNPAPNPVRMEWEAGAWWYKHVPTSAIEEAIMQALRGNADEPMSVADLKDATDETKRKLNSVLKVMVDDGRLTKLPSISTGEGSSGNRYRVAGTENNSYGGLSV